MKLPPFLSIADRIETDLRDGVVIEVAETEKKIRMEMKMEIEVETDRWILSTQQTSQINTSCFDKLLY